MHLTRYLATQSSDLSKEQREVNLRTIIKSYLLWEEGKSVTKRSQILPKTKKVSGEKVLDEDPRLGGLDCLESLVIDLGSSDSDEEGKDVTGHSEGSEEVLKGSLDVEETGEEGSTSDGGYTVEETADGEVTAIGNFKIGDMVTVEEVIDNEEFVWDGEISGFLIDDGKYLVFVIDDEGGQSETTIDNLVRTASNEE